MIVGYVVGVFDQFHHGHHYLLSRAKSQCDRLIIGVHYDDFVESYKRLPHENVDIRMTKIKQTNLGDVVLPMDGNHLKLIKDYNVSRIFHGDDWELKSYQKQIRYFEDGLDKLGVELILLSYTTGISTTLKNKGDLPDLTKYTTFLFDLDNTLTLNHEPMPYAVELIHKLRSLGKSINVITNNNRFTPTEISQELKFMNIPIEENNVYTSLIQVRDFIASDFSNEDVYVWGTTNAKQWLQQNNIIVCSIDEASLIVVLYNDFFNYDELSNLITKCKTIPFITGNIDFTYPDKTMVLPDTGCIEMLITKCTNREPLIRCGKTNKGMVWNSQNSVMIGDSLLTDKIFADNHKIPFFHLHVDGDISNLGVLCDYLD